MPRRPYFKFYANDWTGEGGLHSASFAARGLWLEMIIAMHHADPMGHLIIGIRAFTESAKDVDDLGILFGRQQAETRRAFAELKAAKIYSVTDQGVIYCRGIVRRAERERKLSAAGIRGGGNPALRLPLKVGPKGELYSDPLTRSGEVQSPESTPSLPSVEPESRARRSEAWEFGIWFLQRGQEAGLVPDHVLDLAAAARDDLDDAEALLGAYGLEKCEAASLRFIASTAQRKTRGDGVKRFCLATLAEMWTHFETKRPKSTKAAQDDAIEKAMSGW